MYTAYLVDDEPMVLAQVRESVQWADNNFQIVGEGNDSQQALEEILRLRPDVVFTDIRMPRLSGLELVTALKARGLDALFVVISAFDNFEYVRQVIVLEGFDYLIKPVEAEQMTDLFDRLNHRLSGMRGKKPRPATPSPELNQILAYLGEHFHEKQSLVQIAGRFAINSHYICRLFSKYMDTTFSTYLSRLRMTHAAFLLKDTEKSIKEIALLSGYDDYFYFCRVFKDTYSVTPTQYRSGQ